MPTAEASPPQAQLRSPPAVLCAAPLTLTKRVAQCAREEIRLLPLYVSRNKQLLAMNCDLTSCAPLLPITFAPTSSSELVQFRPAVRRCCPHAPERQLTLVFSRCADGVLWLMYFVSLPRRVGTASGRGRGEQARARRASVANRRGEKLCAANGRSKREGAASGRGDRARQDGRARRKGGVGVHVGARRAGAA